MKKIFLGFLALLVSATLFAAPRTVEEAAEIAAQFTNNQPQLRKAHKAPRKAANMRLAHKALQNNSENAAFYVFNQENENGFIIVSADDRTADEVLGYTENGSFDANNINPNLRFWLNRYAEEITVLQTIDDSEFIAEPQARKAVQVTAIPNLLVNAAGQEITWYQEAPYNNYCPIDQRDNTRSLTGCVATATSAIMYKWQHPAQGQGTHTYTWKDCKNDNCDQYWTKTVTSNFDTVTFNWSNMLPAYEGVSATAAQKKAIASLMYNVGVAANMQYGGDANGGSGAWTDEMAYGLQNYFDYEFDKFITMYSQSGYGTAAVTPAEYSVSRDQFTTYFNTDLEAGRPILMGGEDSDGGGHEFVCSGRDANNKFYINWGWEGSGNGYFAISSLKPTGTTYNFSSNLDALIGLRPKTAPVDPFDITWMANGTQFTTTTSTGKVVLPTTNPAACDGKVFVGWCNQANYSNATTAPTFVKAGDAVESGAIFYAVFATKETAGAGEANWTLVTDASTLAAGDLLVMACTSKGATAGDISSQIMASVTSTFGDNEISSLGDGTVQFTLGGSAGAWTLSNGNKKLGATAVKKVAWDSGTQTWSISISGGDATIQNGTESYGRFLYNATSPRFTTYTSNATSSMLLPQLYRKGAGATYSNYSTTCENSGTDVENVELAPGTRKIIYNGKVYILREGRTYTLTGQEIK